MGYRVGIDLGTTWTAAAVARDDGVVEVVGLGTRSSAVPTLVHVGADGEITVGETAARRGAASPDRLAREVKRRVGDTVPVLLGGQPFAPEALLVEVAAWVIATVTALEGGPPDAVRVTHPANWGPLRLELLEGALRSRGIGPLSLVSEPEAAAAHYASVERVPPGTTVAVYDLGGGTFDATVLRKDATGFAVLGRPEGVDRLGGLDFDAALLDQVASSLGAAWSGLDADDPAVQAGVARLREACVLAKEALSADADATISITLPGTVTDVRITRAELEAMIRPALLRSVEALQRAVSGAGLALDDIDRILLVGGSSRIPLVTEVLASLGRPITSDTHPKHAVALGAARGAGATTTSTAARAAAIQGAAAATPVATSRSASRALRPVLAVVVALVAIGAAAVIALGGGDDDGGRDVESAGATTSTTSPPTTTTVASLALPDLRGSYALTLELDECQPAAATCAEVAELGVEVICAGDEICTAVFASGATSSTATAGDDGAFRFAGPGDPSGVLLCDGEGASPDWELVVTPASTGGEISALDGSLTVAAATGCGPTSATYAVTGRVGEPGDQIGVLAGTWTLVDDLPECTGEGCSFGALAMTLVVECSGAVCTVRLDGGVASALVSADTISVTGITQEAFGSLPDGRGLACDGVAIGTDFGLSLAPQLDGQGRITGSLRLSVDPGGPCSDASYAASFVGIPA